MIKELSNEELLSFYGTVDHWLNQIERALWDSDLYTAESSIKIKHRTQTNKLINTSSG